MKCLLVDDEPGIREGLATLLRRKGHEVRTAGTCAAARAALAEPYDAIVTDWRLPDGVAATFLAAAACPVIAVSGHPEEVECSPQMREVLAKPVTVARLLDSLARCAVAAPNVAAAPLPIDVQLAIDRFVAPVPADVPVALCDDGVFVSLQVDMPATVPFPPGDDGERTMRRIGNAVRWRLRLYRDGRPARAMPVVKAEVEWPAATEFAVDFHDTSLPMAAFAACRERVRELAARGGRVHLLNVPKAWRETAASQGNADDMPMRDAVGPRLPAELAELWREP